MPAKDIFHDCVKHALIKDSWIVTIVLGFHEPKVRQYTGFATA